MNEYIKYARNFANNFLNLSEPIDWNQVGRAHNSKIPNISLYSGSTGLIHFLLELNANQPSRLYQKTIESFVDWVKDEFLEIPVEYYSYHVGVLGLANALVKCDEQLGDKIGKELALTILKKASGLEYKKESIVSDLIHGHAGILLGLLKLYPYYQEQWIAEDIDSIIDILLDRVHLGAQGLFWDPNRKHKRGLTGLAHGTSGIAWIFLELGYCTKNKDFFWLAEQIFTYEQSFYDNKEKNWEDLRCSDENITDFNREYIDKGKFESTAQRYMQAWCHGAPGILLTRLRALKLTGNARYYEEADAVIPGVLNSIFRLKDHSLCHGWAGNSMIILEASSMLRKPDLKLQIEQFAQEVIHSIKQIQKAKVLDPNYANFYDDHSLFLGSLGVAYFMLHLGSDMESNILMPCLDNAFYHEEVIPGINFSREGFLKRLGVKYFPRSSAFQNQFEIPKMDGQTSLKSELMSLFKSSKKLDKELAFLEVLDQEMQIVDWITQYPNDILLSFKNENKQRHQMQLDSFEKLGPEQMSRARVKLSDHCRLYIQPESITNAKVVPPFQEWVNASFLLIRLTIEQVHYKPLTEFSFMVLKTFEENTLLEKGIESIEDQFHIEAVEEKQTLRKLVLKQLMIGLLEGIVEWSFESNF